MMVEPIELNPYAPPQSAPSVMPPKSAARIEGKCLVVPKGWISPPFCLFTGVAEGLTPLKQGKLSYLNPLWIFSVLLSPAVLFLVAVIFTQKGNIYYVLSQEWAGRHRRRLVVNWLIVLVGLSGPFLLGLENVFWFLGVGFVPLLVSLILAVTWCRLLKPAKIDAASIWLKGIPPAVQEKVIKWELGKAERVRGELVNSLGG